MNEQVTTTTSTTTNAVQPVVPATTVEQTTVTTTTETVPAVPVAESVNVNVNSAGGDAETLTLDVPAVPGTTVTTSGGSVNINEG
jgi:hypothetical protein